ncbi:MAG: alpha-glucosidase/alpha-galactosidase, partial [Bacilli bacterium]|nr:alpha-glucosidase/alpha-galactosidase [Bacilli bacterium]
FSKGSFKPIKSKEVPLEVASLIRRNATNILNTYIGIKNRDLDMIFEAFINEPLMSSLTLEESKELFKEMIKGTRKYLDPYYKDIDKYLLS